MAKELWAYEQLAGQMALAQIDTLAKFIQNDVEGEPSQSQGAVDTAIRIITELLERVRELESQGTESN